ncbi:MAG: glutamine--tRNA ligase/YqeY domain fusion protein [Chloroflexi bacterium]|nr:glutamine--tRNA ligase/YqeY domain fusion protein [Chloroflexota bacterium]
MEISNLPSVGKDFIRTIIEEDLRTGKTGNRVVTRFPPEPNGYLHIGHAKSICLNFGLALDYGGVCHLRFDDTNPTTEDIEYVESIQRDIRWLGFDWQHRLFFASDYFDQLYELAVQLIKDGKAYVDSLSEEEIREYRGTVMEPGKESPYRNRSVEENLELFDSMRAGEFPDGAHVLRAKIDMSARNMKLRDPLLFRIRHAHHYRTGDQWPIYPMYDFAHPLSDAIEGITHSICTLEFENNRDIYDWLVDNLFPAPRPHQYEFARLNLDYTVMSKRKLLAMVEGGYVNGWDDPRMPTIAGLRRRGVTPEAIRDFCAKIGVAKTNSRVEIGLLEHCIRDDLNTQAPRVMCVLRPLKVVLTNYPENQVEELDAAYYPYDVPKEGSRPVPFARELYIERDDFAEQPPKGFFRLAPGREVRLRYAYIIKCETVIKDANGEIIELHCTYDADSRGGATGDGRKVKGTIQWVSAAHALPAEVRLYDRLFRVENPDEGADFRQHLNPNSIEILAHSLIEPSVAGAPAGTRYQFERQGYFISDIVDSRPGHLVYNRIVELRDSWTKAAPSTEPSEIPAKPDAGKPETTKPQAKSPDEETAKSSKRTKTELRSEARAALPALVARLNRYTSELGLSFEDADILTGDPATADFFEAALATHNNPKTVANWVNNEVLREVKDNPITTLPFNGAALGALVALVDNNTISNTIAKEVFAEMLKNGGDPQAIVERKGLKQVTDPDALVPIIDKIIAANADKANQYRAGKTGLLGFFVGQAMKESGGKASPQLVQELVRDKLG